MIERTAVAAKLGIKAHAHMLRHGTGFKLANDGIDTRALQAYLGHRNGDFDTRGLVGTGAWKDRKSAERYEHVVVSEEATRADLLPGLDQVGKSVEKAVKIKIVK